MSRFDKDSNEYVREIFEELYRKLLSKLTGMSFVKVGRWWRKGEEIGVVGLNR